MLSRPAFEICVGFSIKYWGWWCSSHAQVAEAALTTALTDRPYLNNSSTSRRDRFRSLPPWHRNGEGTAAGPFGVDEYYAEYSEREGGDMEEDSGLAEIDFRQQYDDFA